MKRAALTEVMAAVIFAGTAFSAAAVCSEPQAAPPSVKIQIVDKLGRVETLPWQVKPRLTWMGATPNVELLINVPEPIQITPEAGPEGRFLKALPERVNGGRTFLGLQRGNAFVYPIVIRRSANDSPHSMLLVVLSATTRTATYMSPECKVAGLRFANAEQTEGLKFVAVHCSTRPSALDIDVYTSPELSPTTPKYKVDMPSYGWEAVQRLSDITVHDNQINRNLGIGVIYAPPEAAYPRFHATTGIGASFYSYDQATLLGRHVSEQAMTLKVAADYNLMPALLDLNANGFATLLPINSASDELGTVRFYGLNLKLGYPLPVDFGGLSYEVYAGAYLLGMSVSGSAFRYGINSATGPELVLGISERHRARRGWSAYAKYALLAEEMFQYRSAGDAEIAAGVSVDIYGSPGKGWALTFDLAKTRFSKPTDSVSLQSLTAGFSRQF